MNFKNCQDCGAIAVERNVAGEVIFSCGSGVDFYVEGWTFVKSDRCLTSVEPNTTGVQQAPTTKG